MRVKPEFGPALRVSESTIPWVFWLLMGAAAAFLLLAVYGLYRFNLPAEVPLDVTQQAGSLTISWPAEQSDNASEAALRVDDGPAQALTPQEKQNGTTTVKTKADTVKIELILSRWGHESRSIVRYVATAKTSVKSVGRLPSSVPAAPGP